MSDLLLQKIEKISIIKHNRDLFKHLCGLELEIRRIDGSVLNAQNLPQPPSNTEAKTAESSCACNTLNSTCLHVDQDVIKRMIASKEPQTFRCQGGLRKIILPIILNDTIIGTVFTGENNSFRFQGNQCQTIMPLLLQFTNYVVENELTPLNINLFENNNITRQKELLNRAVTYIKKNFHSNDLTLKEVSTNNGISYHYLSRIFKSELNTTFAKFRNKVRMEAAAKLLKNQRLSVAQISYACGFDDPAYFCKVFKSHFKTSPLVYRRKRPRSRIQT